MNGLLLLESSILCVLSVNERNKTLRPVFLSLKPKVRNRLRVTFKPHYTADINQLTEVEVLQLLGRANTMDICWRFSRDDSPRQNLASDIQTTY